MQPVPLTRSLCQRLLRAHVLFPAVQYVLIADVLSDLAQGQAPVHGKGKNKAFEGGRVVAKADDDKEQEEGKDKGGDDNKKEEGKDKGGDE